VCSSNSANAFPLGKEVMTAKYVGPMVILQSLHKPSQSVSNLRNSSERPVFKVLDELGCWGPLGSF